MVRGEYELITLSVTKINKIQGLTLVIVIPFELHASTLSLLIFLDQYWNTVCLAKKPNSDFMNDFSCVDYIRALWNWNFFL